MSQPIVVGSMSIVESRTRFFAFDAATGAVRWSVTRDHGTVFPPAADPVSAAVLATEGTALRPASLVALDLATGRTLWRLRLPQPATSPLAVTGADAFVALRDHWIYDVDLSTRSLRRVASADGVVEAAPVVAAGRLFVTVLASRSVGSSLVALDVHTGRVAWSSGTAGFASTASGPTVVGGTVLVGLGDGTARAFEVRSGAPRWVTPLREAMGPQSAPRVDGSTVYLNDRAGALYALDARTGARVWDFQFHSYSLSSAPVVARSAVYLGLEDGAVGAVSRATGHLVWQTRLRFGPIGPLQGAGGDLLAPLLGQGGGIAVFSHSSKAKLVNLTSPSTLDVAAGLARFVPAAVAVSAALVAIFRWVLPRRFGVASGRQVEGSKDRESP